MSVLEKLRSFVSARSFKNFRERGQEILRQERHLYRRFVEISDFDGHIYSTAPQLCVEPETEVNVPGGISDTLERLVDIVIHANGNIFNSSVSSGSSNYIIEFILQLFALDYRAVPSRLQAPHRLL